VSNKDRFDSLDARATGIEARLTDIETRLGITVPNPKNALIKLYEKAVNHKGTTIIIAVVAIFGSVFGSNLYRRHLEHQDRDFNYSVDGRIDGKLTPVNVKLDGLTQRMATIEGKLDGLIIQRFAAQPTDKKNIAEAKAIINTAKQSAIKLPPSIVEQSGKAFINAASKEPAAWDVALRFAEYRSYLNTFNPDVIPSGNRATNTEYTLSSPIGYAKPSLSITGLVSADQAARFNRIGEGLKTDTVYGNAFIIVTGGAAILDGYELKNVVFQNTHVVYLGGPLQLKNVYFIGCTFDFISDNNGKEMVAAILSSPAISLGLS
jgi:hypothetical protein